MKASQPSSKVPAKPTRNDPYKKIIAFLFQEQRPTIEECATIHRFQQFQARIKRHAFKIHTRMRVDRTTGNILAFAADHTLNGGGLANYSASVAAVARMRQ